MFHIADMYSIKSCPLSISKLGPPSINYLTEGSLFFANQQAVLVFGGMDPHCQYGVSHNTAKHVYRYRPDRNLWQCVGELPEPRLHHSVAFLNGRVYVIGGADPQRDDARGKSVNTVWSYDPVSRSWSSDCAMLTPRKSFGLVACNSKLYAIGGEDRRGRCVYLGC